MRALNLLRRLALLAPALVLPSCVYQPVVIDSYRQVSGYAELLNGIEGEHALHAAIDKNATRVLQAGELVPGWSETGLNLDEVLDAAPGGAARNVYRLERAGELSFVSRQTMQEFFGPDYTTYPITGTASSFEGAQDDRSVALLHMGEGIWLETLTSGEKIGNANCASTRVDSARLHTRRPFDSLDKLEKSKLAAYVTGVQRDDATICSVAEPDGAARWKSRNFLPDGRRLPVMDREAPGIRIVPRAEMGQVIAGA